MYRRQDFEINDAREALSGLKGTFVFPDSEDYEEVNNILDIILFKFNMYKQAPKYNLSRQFFTIRGTNKLYKVKFNIRPSSRYSLSTCSYSISFEVSAGDDFFDRFIDNIIEWFDGYVYLKRIESNLAELNTKMEEIILENNIKFTLKFSVGSELLLDVSNSHAVIRLSNDVVMDLASLPLFDEDNVLRRNSYRNSIIEVLKRCKRPYDIFKVKSVITQEHLNIYTTTQAHKLIKKCVKKDIDSVNTGLGYFETEDIFAVIEKRAVTKAELKSYDQIDHHVITNKRITAQDKRDGKDKIVFTYRITPTSKKDGSQVNMNMMSIVATIKQSGIQGNSN
jgi:hypothetical protein